MEERRVDFVTDFYKNRNLHLVTYEAVNKFKSVSRAIRRGHVAVDGTVYPNRPFHNKANTCTRGKHSRANNELKKEIYEQVMSKIKQRVQ